MAEHKVGYVLNETEATDLERSKDEWSEDNVADYGKFKVLRHSVDGKFYYEIVCNTETMEYILPGYTRKIGGMRKTDLGYVKSCLYPPTVPRSLGSTKTFVQISAV